MLGLMGNWLLAAPAAGPQNRFVAGSTEVEKAQLEFGRARNRRS